MKHINQKNMKIVNEVMLYCLNLGARNITTKFIKYDNKVTITIDSVLDHLDTKDLNKIRFLLSQPRKPEMEEYYWNLNGGDDTDSELSLVGMMTDEVSIHYKNSLLSITLNRFN